jgi:hypothetical protein
MEFDRQTELLENYAIDENGVIYQVGYSELTYDFAYVELRYNHNAPVSQMAHLRLGYLLAAIGHTPSSLLDVGYGNGEFLRTAKTLVDDCNGYDIPPAYPLPSSIIQQESLYSREFEVVTFFDSLEHFRTPYEIGNLRCRYVMISVPWCHYVDREWFAEWKHRRPDEHLWHFGYDSLVRFFASIGFRLLRSGNPEDAIRGSLNGLPNILTAVFERA